MKRIFQLFLFPLLVLSTRRNTRSETLLPVPASPELQQIITTERTSLGPLGDYVGLSVKAAKTKAIGDPVVFLPLVFGQ